MIKSPTFQPEPLRHWFQYTLISMMVIVSVFFFLATLKVLLLWYGGQVPGIPPAPVQTRAGQAPPLPGTVTATAVPLVMKTRMPTLVPTRAVESTVTETPAATEAGQGQVTALPSATPAGQAPPLPETAMPRTGSVHKLTRSGLVAVFIPGGRFRIGDPNGGGNDSPRHTVQLSAYWISRTQVTNAQYARCVKAGGCSKPIRKSINPHYYDARYANHPVVYITWDQAQAFCEWTGGSLPSEAQWEHAASGNRERTYPWGEGEPASYFTNVHHPNGGTVEVGKNKGNASPFGVLDMGSNVREWVADWYAGGNYRVSEKVDPAGPAKGEKKVLRGAGWGDPNNFSMVWHRLSHVPGSPGANRGFRCAFPGELGINKVEVLK